MILTHDDIIRSIQDGDITIDHLDFSDLEAIGTNSVDLRLSPFIITLCEPGEVLDVRYPPDLTYKEISADGLILQPGTLYLASTTERTKTPKHIPVIEGKSSVARMGISVHAAAGFGDIGFEGHWTLEITVAQPIRVIAGMKICQVYFYQPSSIPSETYLQRKSSSYTQAWNDPKPQPSKLWQKLRGISPQP